MTKPNDPIPNPNTGKFSFGLVPKGKSGSDTIPEGEIQLRHGKHRGVNRGFGLEHIWAEHRKEMAQVGLYNKNDVPTYVAKIVRTGSAIYYEGGYYKNQRIAVIRSSSGTAILEWKGSVWSIVTAYSGKNINGTRVGAVQ